jgi:hypothetical protein
MILDFVSCLQKTGPGDGQDIGVLRHWRHIVTNAFFLKEVQRNTTAIKN